MAVDKLIHKLGTGKFVPKMTILAEPVGITCQTLGNPAKQSEEPVKFV